MGEEGHDINMTSLPPPPSRAGEALLGEAAYRGKSVSTHPPFNLSLQPALCKDLIARSPIKGGHCYFLPPPVCWRGGTAAASAHPVSNWTLHNRLFLKSWWQRA